MTSSKHGAILPDREKKNSHVEKVNNIINRQLNNNVSYLIIHNNFGNAMKCLLLGGTGFIGKNLAQALTANGHQVSVLSRNAANNSNWYHQHYTWDVNKNFDELILRKALEGQDILIHLLSTTLPKSSNADPIYDIESNLIPTVKLLNIVREYNLKKIIFLSSGGTIYGQPHIIPIPEDHPIKPLCSYGIMKHTIEQYLTLYHHLYGINYCILRLSNPYGKYQSSSRGQGAITTFLKQALNKQQISIWGDGEIIRDYIYVTDVVAAIAKAIDYKGSEHIFNIGSGEGKSLNEILTEIEILLNYPIQRLYTPNRLFDVKTNILDIAKAREHLGWEPITSFKLGLEKTMEWIKTANNN